MPLLLHRVLQSAPSEAAPVPYSLARSALEIVAGVGSPRQKVEKVHECPIRMQA